MTLAIGGLPARPYLWPCSGRLRPGRAALLVCGAQPELEPVCPGAAEVVRRLEALSDELAGCGTQVVATRHVAPPALARPVGLPAARGAAAVSFAPPGGTDLEVDAYGFDGFAGNALEQWLRGQGIDHLILGGVWLEGPVHSTLRSANDRGFECLLLEDGVAPCRPDLVEASLSMVRMSGGIFGATSPIGPLEELIHREGGGRCSDR